MNFHFVAFIIGY